MAGYDIVTFTSTNTGNTKEDCIAKSNDILSQVSNFICTLVDGLSATEYDYDTSTGQRGYAIGHSDGVVRWLLEPNSTTTVYRIYCKLKYNDTSKQNGDYTDIQTSATTSGEASMKVAYKSGLNGDIAVWLLGYNKNAPITVPPHMMYIRSTECGGAGTAGFWCLGTNTVIYYSTDDDAAYRAKNQTGIDAGNIFALSGSSYDMAVPFPIGGTKYVADNVYMFTNSSGISSVTALQDGNKRYLMIKPGAAGLSLLMRIE